MVTVGDQSSQCIVHVSNFIQQVREQSIKLKLLGNVNLRPTPLGLPYDMAYYLNWIDRSHWMRFFKYQYSWLVLIVQIIYSAQGDHQHQKKIKIKNMILVFTVGSVKIKNQIIKMYYNNWMDTTSNRMAMKLNAALSIVIIKIWNGYLFICIYIDFSTHTKKYIYIICREKCSKILKL